MSKEIIKEIHKAEDRIKRVKRYMRDSSYLNSIVNTGTFALTFNEYSCSINLIVVDNYRILVDALKTLRAENIKCEFKHHFNLSGVDTFTFTDGYIDVCFRCEKDGIPKQLEYYIGR